MSDQKLLYQTKLTLESDLKLLEEARSSLAFRPHITKAYLTSVIESLELLSKAINEQLTPEQKP